MLNKLVIVESPAKCKKIEDYLGVGYKCIASYGHIRELNKKKGINSIDIDNNYNPEYKLVSSQTKNISKMKKYAEMYDEVLIATDDDREGEAIGWHICDVLKLPVKKTKRLIFNEITKSALEKAVNNPTIIDMDKVYSQRSRQVLDLLVGYSISPLLWKYINKKSVNSLSAGRCQTPALRLVYDNNNDIKENPGKECYNIKGIFGEEELEFILNKTLDNKELVEEFLEKSKKHNHKIMKCNVKEIIKKAPEPLTTSKIQQKASNILNYSPKETMSICQRLYECGLITYMRTDSKTYSKEFIDIGIKLIKSKYGEDYINEEINKLLLSSNSNKDSNAQEAHEAIRPTDIYKYYIEENREKIGSKEIRMYNLIWKNTMESMMCDSIYNLVKCELKGVMGYNYTKSEEEVKFEGWTIIENNIKDNEAYKTLLDMRKGSILENKKITATYGMRMKKQHYTEAKLVSILEKKGIGRPSTYSSIISKIQERGYVKKDNIIGRKIECIDYILENEEITKEIINRELGNEMNKLVLQPIGVLVIEFLLKYFPSIFDYKYTKEMEKSLDKIADGKKKWYKLCDECYKLIIETKENMTDEIKKEYEFMIDEKHKFKVGKYGCVIEYTDDDDKKCYYKVNEDISIKDIKNNKVNIDEIIRNNKLKKKNEVLGYIEENEVVLKKGKFGLFVVYKDKNYSLKGINKSQSKITIDDVKEIIENQSKSSIVRYINSDISIRSGKYGNYIFYKTKKMKKAKFISLNKCPLDYMNCSIEEFNVWFDS